LLVARWWLAALIDASGSSVTILLIIGFRSSEAKRRRCHCKQLFRGIRNSKYNTAKRRTPLSLMTNLSSESVKSNKSNPGEGLPFSNFCHRRRHLSPYFSRATAGNWGEEREEGGRRCLTAVIGVNRRRRTRMAACDRAQ